MDTKKNRMNRQLNDQKMSDATLLHLANIASLPVGNATMTPAQIAQIYKDRVATNQAVLDANAQHVEAVKADRDKQAQTGPVTRAYRRIVQGMFAQSPMVLADFGLTPPKVVTKTVETKSAAVAKAKATRAARHTMGSKQRAKITGTTVSAGTGSSTAPAAPPATGVTAPAAVTVTAGPAPVAVTAPVASPTPGAAPAAAPAPVPGPAAAPAAAPATPPAEAPTAPQTPAH
ncbi:MAG TPA: hypothetical protein VHV30_13995 [Polyangiaceae bacterium]|jgi:hypothetical protein|nr:hypothetical protein [Polyangiaceae bacterium]